MVRKSSATLRGLEFSRTRFDCDQAEGFVEPEPWPVVGLSGDATICRAQDDDASPLDQSSGRREAVDADAEKRLVALRER